MVIVTQRTYGALVVLGPVTEVFGTTDLSGDRLVSEIENFHLADFITWIDGDEKVTDFKKDRFTKQGFQMVHEQKQAERRLEWRKESANVGLTIATIVLAVTAFFRTVAVLLGIQPLI